MEVLLIEDNPDFARAVVELLRLEGHTVVWTTGVASARYYLRRGTPWGAVILDWKLSDGTADQLFDELPAGACAILLSGVDRSAELRRMTQRLDHVLVKGPTSIERMLAICREHESGRRESGA